MAKYLQPNFIVDSSAAFLKNVTFDSSVLIRGHLDIDGSLFIGDNALGTMAFESSTNFYASNQVDAIKISIDASIERIDASLNNVIDIDEVIAFKYTGTFDGSALSTLDVSALIHELGIGPLMVTVYDGNEIVYINVINEANGDIKLTWESGSLSDSCKYIIIG